MKIAAVLLLATAALGAQFNPGTDRVLPQAKELYFDIHSHPELSWHETRTAEALASKLRAVGFEVTEQVGKTGVVGVLKNGNGPVVLLRTELDALPVEEKTRLPYASKVHTKNDAGQDVGVMHACGHDVHIASLYGTAARMANEKDKWHGTLIVIGQPAEEVGGGAEAMIKDGLFTRFPRPQYAIAFHDGVDEPAGDLSVTDGYVLANADTVRVTMYGKGTHGSAPQDGIDPVLMIARATVALQSIVSREIAPGEPAVVTVGFINAGTKENIIPDHAEMGLTVRSYSDATRQHLLASIQRIVKAEAQAAGAEKEPKFEIRVGAPSVYNDPKLAARLRSTLQQTFGADHVRVGKPAMAGDDFAEMGRSGIPAVMVRFGVANPQEFADAKRTGKQIPSNHSPLFAPDADPSLRTAITAETAVLQNLLQ